MPEHFNILLISGASLSAIAALLHIAIIIGGSKWYRYFGAGEHFASAAAAGQWWPDLVTVGISCALGAFAAYALSGAGVIQPLPHYKLALMLITAVYLLRGLAFMPVLLFARNKVTPLLFWSSLVCIGNGAIHLLGLVQIWSRLSAAL